MTWEINKLYRTRDGRKARIYGLDGGGDYPILGALWEPETNMWRQERWRADGRCYVDTSETDLIPPTPAVSDAVQKAFDDAYERDGLEIREALAAAIAADRAERPAPEPDDEAIQAGIGGYVGAVPGLDTDGRIASAIRAAIAHMNRKGAK